MRMVLAKNWWSLVIRGVAGILMGLVTVFWPAITAGAGLRYRRMGGVIALWVGAYALVSGVLLVLLGFRLRSWERWHVAGTGIPLPAH